MTSIRWHPAPSVAELQRSAAQRTLAAAARAIAATGRFRIVLAGGETPRGVYRLLAAAPADWKRWEIWYGDERCLPATDAGRNSVKARLDWLGAVPIPPGQVHEIPAETGPEPAAASYTRTLAGVGDFDLVLLGLGEDGHTASLFPGNDWGDSPGARDALAVFNAPKPPPERVSLSAARLSRAEEVLFLVTGASKREAVARWKSGEHVPAAAIRPRDGVDVLVAD